MYKIGNNVLSWIPEEEIEEKALQQIKNLSSMPFIFHHVGVMPDCHFGRGATIGSVIPTRGAVIPAAVGVDIGCGMVAAKTNLTSDDLPEDLSDIRKAIERQIPLSVGKYNRRIKDETAVRVDWLEQFANSSPYRSSVVYDDISPNWRKQLGSLGSGNHFIEIVLDEQDRVWAFLHSGSRGIGNKIAQRHINVAKLKMEQYFIDLPDPDLAYLVEDTIEYKQYLADLTWAQLFAFKNREEMMYRVLKVLKYRFPFMEELDRIECHHNFSQMENHFGHNVLISRKGAISAREGQLGLIPGSMGTRSYVVKGKGCKPSFNTAPHGAGRRLSRGQAFKTFTMEDFERDMEGIEVRHSKQFLDELPGAYKDIDHVMEQSKDLVEIVHTFRQVVNVKGD